MIPVTEKDRGRSVVNHLFCVIVCNISRALHPLNLPSPYFIDWEHWLLILGTKNFRILYISVIL